MDIQAAGHAESRPDVEMTPADPVFRPAGRSPGSNRQGGWRLQQVAAVVCVTALAFGVAACGGDDKDTGTTSTKDTLAEAPAATDASATGNDQVCAIATEIAGQDDFPTEDQLTRYQAVAPAEIADAVDVMAEVLMDAGGDMMKFWTAFADDDVERALPEINTWETDNCGIDHGGEPGAPLAGGATREREEGATVVDVIATDYAFRLGSDAIAPGRTSLVLTNNGREAHYVQLFRLAEGATMEQVMASQDGGAGLIDGDWDSGVAAAGGADDEVLTLDLESGAYGMACFVSGADGTPHALMGMTLEFTVA